jgi:glutamate N-acetyltransferase / amino-acid N-acetyltransferase
MGSTAKLSPFAPAVLATLPPISGVRFATAEAGIRYKGRTDLMMAVFDEGTVAAGVLTQSKTCSAPVLQCRAALASGATAKALVVNSGNANAFTGMRGKAAVDVTVAAAKAATGAAEPGSVYIASTGVIGEPLAADRFVGLLGQMSKSATADRFEQAARAILTTDTYPKLATRTVEIGGIAVTINGFCKGAGMIAPDMATMLCFIFTDAVIAQPLLQRLVSAHADQTFNCITVDGDTSTSDTLLVFATGASAKRGAPLIADMADPNCGVFAGALRAVMHDLALQVVKDGEGLTKFVTFKVWGAEDDGAARRIAFSCANSPILKTAIAGEDPNWGRVVMAVGKSGQAADRDRLSIWFGPHQVAHMGERSDGYQENVVASYMKQPDIVIAIDVGIGGGAATVWTCDLTHDYVAINADYRS